MTLIILVVSGYSRSSMSISTLCIFARKLPKTLDTKNRTFPFLLAHDFCSIHNSSEGDYHQALFIIIIKTLTTNCLPKYGKPCAGIQIHYLYRRVKHFKSFYQLIWVCLSLLINDSDQSLNIRFRVLHKFFGFFYCGKLCITQNLPF